MGNQTTNQFSSICLQQKKLKITSTDLFEKVDVARLTNKAQGTAKVHKVRDGKTIYIKHH